MFKEYLLFIITIGSFCGCMNSPIIRIINQKQHYDFRNVRWGMTQEQVELAEVGNTVVWRIEREVIYRSRINDVPCKVVYTFKDNKLRTAGYITNIPVKNADNPLNKSYEDMANQLTRVMDQHRCFQSLLYTPVYINPM